MTFPIEQTTHPTPCSVRFLFPQMSAERKDSKTEIKKRDRLAEQLAAATEYIHDLETTLAATKNELEESNKALRNAEKKHAEFVKKVKKEFTMMKKAKCVKKDRDGNKLAPRVLETTQDGTLVPRRPRKMNDGKELRRDTRWWEHFRSLQRYRGIHGHCNVSTKDTANKVLGGWVSLQRTNFRLLEEGKSSTLTVEQIELLNSVGFQWSLRKSWRMFETRIEQLKEYKRLHGHCNVPFRDAEGIPEGLGGFVVTKRRQYREQELSDEHFEILEEIGFQWSLRSCGRTVEGRRRRRRTKRKANAIEEEPDSKITKKEKQNTGEPKSPPNLCDIDSIVDPIRTPDALNRKKFSCFV